VPVHVEVWLDSGLAIITGDNAYLADPSISKQIPPGYVTSIPATTEALADIARRADHVLPMHDLPLDTDTLLAHALPLAGLGAPRGPCLPVAIRTQVRRRIALGRPRGSPSRCLYHRR